MTEQNVPPAAPPSEPSVWADIAAELHRIADDCMDLVGEPAPGLFDLNIQPHNADGSGENTAKNRPHTVAAVDFVANILLGVDAKTYKLGADTFHHGAHGKRGPLSLDIYTSVADPDAVDPEMELARLREEGQRLAEENARLRAAAGLDHSRDDGPVDAHAGRVPPHLEDGRNPGEAAIEICGGTTPDGPCQMLDGHGGQCEREPWNSSKPYVDRVAESMERNQ